MAERLQKLLSAAGVCSRRTAESYIAQGRVTVDGRVARLGERAEADCLICLDGKPVARPKQGRRHYIMLHKPTGYVTTLSDEKGRPTVADLVADCPARVWPVGRLDYNSEGLLLLTDDGEFTNRLTHPRHGMEKEYLVEVAGDIAGALPILRGPMELDGVPLAPVKVEQVGPHTLDFTLTQGKNRQIRRMCRQANLRVKALKRYREGSLLLGDLPPGKWRELTPAEVAALEE